MSERTTKDLSLIRAALNEAINWRRASAESLAHCTEPSDKRERRADLTQISRYEQLLARLLEPSGTTGPADAPSCLRKFVTCESDEGPPDTYCENCKRKYGIVAGPADAGSHETLRAILREVHAALCGCPIVVIDREKHPHGDLLGMRRSDAAKVLAALEAASASAPAVPRETKTKDEGSLGSTS
jgi:hypothetical protein